jgi:hypothetical protein
MARRRTQVAAALIAAVGLTGVSAGIAQASPPRSYFSQRYNDEATCNQDRVLNYDGFQTQLCAFHQINPTTGVNDPGWYFRIFDGNQ